MGFNGVSRYCIRLLYLLYLFNVVGAWAASTSAVNLPAPNIVSSQQGSQGAPGVGLFTAQQLAPCTTTPPSFPAAPNINIGAGWVGPLATCNNSLAQGFSTSMNQLMGSVMAAGMTGQTAISGAPAVSGGMGLAIGSSMMGSMAPNVPCPPLTMIPEIDPLQPLSCSVLRAGVGKSLLNSQKQELKQEEAALMPEISAAACMGAKASYVQQEIECVQAAANQVQLQTQAVTQNNTNGANQGAPNSYNAAYNNMTSCMQSLTQASADQQEKLQNIQTAQQNVTQALQQAQELQTNISSAIPSLTTQSQQLKLYQNAFPTSQQIYLTANIMSCMTSMTTNGGSTPYSCDMGKTATNVFSYIACITSNSALLGTASNGLRIINMQNAGANYQGQIQTTNINSAIQSMTAGNTLSSAMSYPSDPGELLTYTNVLSQYQTPASLQNYISTSIPSTTVTMSNGTQENIQQIVLNQFNYCKNRASASINQATAGGAGQFGAMNLQIQSLQNNLASTANNLISSINQNYSTAFQSISTAAPPQLMGNGCISNGTASGGQSLTPAAQISCLTQAQTAVNTLINGPRVPGAQPLVIAGSNYVPNPNPGNVPSNLSISCNQGLQNCTTQLNNAKRNVQETSQNITLAQSQYPQQMRQKAQASVNALAASLSGPANQINARIQTLNQAMTSMGMQPIPLGSTTPCVLDQDNSGLPNLNINVAQCVQQAANPALPDLNNLNQIAATPGEQKAQAMEMLAAAKRTMGILKKEEQKLAQLPTQCADQENKEIFKNAGLMANQAANCACEEAQKAEAARALDGVLTSQQIQQQNQQNQMASAMAMNGGAGAYPLAGMPLSGMSMGRGGMNPYMQDYAMLSSQGIQNQMPGFPSAELFALQGGIANACGGGDTEEDNDRQSLIKSLQASKQREEESFYGKLDKKGKVVKAGQKTKWENEIEKLEGEQAGLQEELHRAINANSAQQKQVAEAKIAWNKQSIDALQAKIKERQAAVNESRKALSSVRPGASGTGQVSNKPKNCSMINTALESVKAAGTAKAYGGSSRNAENAHVAE